jgi:MFS family permease
MTAAPAPANGRAAAVPLLVLAVFLDLIGFGIVVPQLPLAAARFDAHGVVAGLLVATDSLFSFFLAPVWGRLSDRVGRRPVILVGLAASAASYALFGLAPSLAVLFLSRVLSGGLGATVTVAQAFLADVTPLDRRSQAMGLVGAAFGVAFTIGPIIGGIAATVSPGAPGYVAAAICGANLLLALVLLPESRERREQAWGSRGDLGRHAALVAALSTFAFTTVYVVFQGFARDSLGLSRSAISYCFALLGLVTALVQGRLVGVLAPRVGERALIVAGGSALATGLGLVALAAHAGGLRMASLLAGVALLAAGFSFIGPCVAGLVSRGTSGEAQGRALGALQSVGSGARIVGPPLLGFTSDTGGYGAAFGLAAVAALAAAVTARLWPRRPTA